MNSDAIARLRNVLLPLVLLIFLSLYVLGLTAGIEPEIALLRAGAAGIVLALLARAALWILAIPPRQRPAPEEAEEGKGQHVDVAVGDQPELPELPRTDADAMQRRQGQEVADAAR